MSQETVLTVETDEPFLFLSTVGLEVEQSRVIRRELEQPGLCHMVP